MTDYERQWGIPAERVPLTGQTNADRAVLARKAEPYVHAYFHPDPQDCTTYQQCHGRAYGIMAVTEG